MYEQPNFYWAQENFLRRACKKVRTWHFSILRPVLIVGLTIGGAMDLIFPPARRLLPLSCAEAGQRRWIIPAERARVSQAVDVDLLGAAPNRVVPGEGGSRAQTRPSMSPMATSFTWEKYLAGDLRTRPRHKRPGLFRAVWSLAKEYPNWIAPWDALRRKHNLIAPGSGKFRRPFVSSYADYSMRYGQTQSGPPSIVSTVKINQGRFHRDDGYGSDVPEMVQAGTGGAPAALTHELSLAPALAGRGSG